MTKKLLKNAIEKASAEFADAIINAVKGASLQELMEIQKSKPAAKKPGRKARKKPGPRPKKRTYKKKPGPKPKKKTARKKPGPKPKKKTAAKARGKTGAKKPRRLTTAQKAKVQDKIHAYLAKNPWSSRGKVAKAMRLPSAKTGLYLRELKKAGKVKSKGNKATTRYAASGK